MDERAIALKALPLVLPKGEEPVTAPAELCLGLLSGSVGFGKATTPASVLIPASNLVRQSPGIIRVDASIGRTACLLKASPKDKSRIRQSGTWTAGVLAPGNAGGDSPPLADIQSDLNVVTTNDQLHILVFYLVQESESPYDHLAWLVPV
ncbi:hypothetical protein F4859DRAFT_518481 [Xylaria cf. heliscus]|nr:hypothetical protein F4859DRAFT_518481 [Xylaria cf. heliscus]